jgi:hypothetical protein
MDRAGREAIASYDPVRIPNIKYYYDLRIPIQRFTRTNNRQLRSVVMVIEILSRFIAIIAPKQCNEFAFAVSKNGALHSYRSI